MPASRVAAAAVSGVECPCSARARLSRVANRVAAAAAKRRPRARRCPGRSRSAASRIPPPTTANAPTATELRRLAPAGLAFGLSYVLLFEAYWRGRVTVVSPLVATESLWGVGLSALLVRHTEGVGRRLAVGALLVVAGGALIGAYR